MIRVKTPYRVSFVGGGTDLLSYALIYGGEVIGASINKYISVTLDKEALSSTSDLKRESGLGGSAAYLSGMARIAYPNFTKREIIDVVTEKEKLGMQDQTLCVTGGLNHAVFNPDGTWLTESIPVPAWLDECMAIYYLGNRQVEGKSLLSGINEDALHAQKALVPKMVTAMKDKDFDTFVDTIQEAWAIKKDFRPDLVTDHVKEFEATCEQKGVLAFKLCGAGGGGYALLIREPDTYSRIGQEVTVSLSGQTFVRRQDAKS